MPPDECLQAPGDDLRVPAELEIRFDPLLQRAELQLLEPARLVLGERLGREVGEGSPRQRASAALQLERPLLTRQRARLA